MSFYEELTAATARERARLLASPIIVDCLAGRVTKESYVAFLTQAYHHVRHTVPLLMACGSRLPERLEWLRTGIVTYIDEEHGHERWILDDIAACGADPDPDAAANGVPDVATELMVGYAYDTIARVNPVGLLGMIYVLEGTSVTIASRAADVIENRLGLPRRAFTYLRSHGSVDVKHIEDFAHLVNRLDDAADRASVIHCARIVFKLYADVFAGLPRAGEAMDMREVA